jgi:tetratricopeptide (TPR) repeat protein
MTIRNRGLRDLGITLLLFAPVAAAAGFVLAARLRAVPSLDGLDPLLAAGRFDEVERRGEAYLREHPASIPARILMAQVALARGDQRPRQALDHLARIHTRDPATLAIVRLNEGKAYSAMARYDRAEAAWKDAIRLDPLVPEAGWALLGLYYIQGRRADAHHLALALHAIEPDPRDRVQLLLELLRQDAKPLVSETLFPTLEPAVRDHPEDLYTAITLGLALVRSSRFDQGLGILRSTVSRHTDSPDAWDGLLRGLDEARRLDELAQAWEKLPPAMAADPRFDRHRGAIAQERQDWSTAADTYLRAWRADPSDLPILYRLSRVLQVAGRREEAAFFGIKARAAIAARDRALALYREADSDKTLGLAPHPDLYHRIADLREQMGRGDEALAWHRLVLRDQPQDAVSRKAVARMEADSALNSPHHQREPTAGRRASGLGGLGSRQAAVVGGPLAGPWGRASRGSRRARRPNIVRRRVDRTERI